MNFSFKRFLDTFVPGFMVTIFVWYAYRPYINLYFPSIAFDSADLTFSNEVKIIFLLVLSFFLGILINHFSDSTLALIYPHNDSEKSKRPFKRLASFFFGLISWNNNDDPRIYSLKRYLKSNRKKVVLELLEDWCMTNEDLLNSDVNEYIISHQHLGVRLRALKSESEKIFNDSLAEVNFAASLLTSMLIIFPLTIIVLVLNNFSNITTNMAFMNNSTLIIFLILEYVVSCLFCFSLVRRFRHFSSQIITIAIHFYEESKKMTS